MAVYWISFRVGHEDDYQARYTSLVDGLKSISLKYWEETTSFLVIETDQDIDSIASIANDAVDRTTDLVLVRAMDSKNARLIGIEGDDDIFKLMPYLKYA